MVFGFGALAITVSATIVWVHCVGAVLYTGVGVSYCILCVVYAMFVDCAFYDGWPTLLFSAHVYIYV